MRKVALGEPTQANGLGACEFNTVAGIRNQNPKVSAALPSQPPERLLTVSEVADWLRVTPAWVRAHANGNREPKLPSVKLGAHRRFRREDVERFIEELSRAA